LLTVKSVHGLLNFDRKTYGLRDEEYFILRLKALHLAGYDLRLGV
jgi:hypothetical protein